MSPDDRRRNILSRVRALRQEWRVDELAVSLGVSPLTIRRDLDRMAADGLIVRTHGGCIAVSGLQNSDYVRQVASNFEEKQAIGREASRLVKKGDVLMLNDGSTTFHLASCLGECGPITVYTNSIAMIEEFGRFPNIKLYIVGGEYHADLFYLGGSLASRVLADLEADIVFLGTDAIDSNGRCLVRDQDTAGMARTMLFRGRRRILLADGTKTRSAAGVVYADLNDFDQWITSSSLESSALRRFSKKTQVRVAK